MIIENKLDYSFGKTGTFAGYFLILGGLLSITNVIGIFLILIGAFMSFSHSGALIDTEGKEIMFYNKIFGLFKTGRGIKISNFNSLVISKNKRTNTTFSRGNRSLTLNEYDYRVFIVDSKGKQRIPLIKCNSKEEALKEAEKISLLIDLPIIT